ncbi:MAG: malate dehydrogenase [Planctomycetes bacterium]|nr:malate dehydrogenase [Planctomycetota bacterium]
MARTRIGVVGAGFVGMTVAQRIAEKQIGDVILTDIVEGMPQGKGLDMCEAGPIERYDSHVTGTNSLDDLRGCDLVVVTAGLPRKPGMTREDLIDKNAEILRSVAGKVAAAAPDAILVMVSNPLDIMTYLAWKLTNFPKQRIVGMAGVLDSARFSWFVAEKLNCSMQDITAMVLGGHGDAMVPMPRYTTVSGIPITDLMSESEINALVQRTRDGGAEIVKLLKTGSAYYAPSAAVAAMVASILRDERRILPSAAILDGEYGLKGTCIGVPCVLGRNGIEKVIELKLTETEAVALRKSADEVRKGIEHLKL